MHAKTRELVEAITTGNSSIVREKLDEIISSMAIDALEFKKVGVARGFFAKEPRK